MKIFERFERSKQMIPELMEPPMTTKIAKAVKKTANRTQKDLVSLSGEAGQSVKSTASKISAKLQRKKKPAQGLEGFWNNESTTYPDGTTITNGEWAARRAEGKVDIRGYSKAEAWKVALQAGELLSMAKDHGELKLYYKENSSKTKTFTVDMLSSHNGKEEVQLSHTEKFINMEGKSILRVRKSGDRVSISNASSGYEGGFFFAHLKRNYLQVSADLKTNQTSLTEKPTKGDEAWLKANGFDPEKL